MDKHSFPNIEKFAAFLDDNLPQDEMHQFSQLAEHDVVLRQLLDANSIIDNTIVNYGESDLLLPPEISGSSFEIPTILTHDISQFITLSTSPSDNIMVAAAACADETDENITSFSDTPLLDNQDIHNVAEDQINHAQDNDGMNGMDDFANIMPDSM